jgi:hypothetical protein
MTNFQKPDPRRFMLRVFALCEARQIVKHRLKAEGKRPTHYAQREISVMAQAYLEGHYAELEEKAYARIMASPRLRAEYEKEAAKHERQLAKRREREIIEAWCQRDTGEVRQ